MEGIPKSSAFANSKGDHELSKMKPDVKEEGRVWDWGEVPLVKWTIIKC